MAGRRSNLGFETHFAGDRSNLGIDADAAFSRPDRARRRHSCGKDFGCLLADDAVAIAEQQFPEIPSNSDVKAGIVIKNDRISR